MSKRKEDTGEEQIGSITQPYADHRRCPRRIIGMPAQDGLTGVLQRYALPVIPHYESREEWNQRTVRVIRDINPVDGQFVGDAEVDCNQQTSASETIRTEGPWADRRISSGQSPEPDFYFRGRPGGKSRRQEAKSRSSSSEVTCAESLRLQHCQAGVIGDDILHRICHVTICVPAV